MSDELFPSGPWTGFYQYGPRDKHVMDLSLAFRNGRMTGRSVVAWCKRRPGVTDEYPFGPDTRVFKVGGKMFAICPRGVNPNHVSLKADPATALRLRRKYPAILPGYHLNKRHWNTVILDGSLPDDAVRDMIEDSYDLVVSKLPRGRSRALDWRDVSD